MEAPKVFISYSWKPMHNKQKVMQLAERLSNDFVHVIIDEWNLKEGQDKYHFMEQMVNNLEVKRVLIICNKEYTEKANAKSGGVGIESLILSDEIYNKVAQTKFIPIIFEFDEKGKPYVPTFVHSRIFIDLSSDSIFEENYELLLRNIFDRPASKRPPLGTMPSFLLSEEPIYLPTAHKVATIKNALINEKKNTPLYIKDYLTTFLTSLTSFEIDEKETDTDNFYEIMDRKIEDLKVLRDDFINFIETYLSYSVEIDVELIHDFFEKSLNFIENRNSYPSNTIGNIKGDAVKFLYYELFLTFTVVMIENERFKELAFILQTPFIVYRDDSNQALELTFAKFRYYIKFLNELKRKKYNLNFISVTTETIKQRATSKYSFEKLVEADIFLYYISQLFPDRMSYRAFWFPETSYYKMYGSIKIKLLSKTVSERYFNKFKILLGVNSKEELLDKVDEISKSKKYEINDGYYNTANIRYGLAIEEMCTIR